MSGAADEQVAQAKKFALEHLQQTPDDALHLLKMKDVYEALRLKGLDVSADRSLKDAVKATITEFAAKREQEQTAAEEDDDEPAIPLGEPEAKRQKKAAPAAAAAGGAPAASSSSSSSRAAAPPAAAANGGGQHNVTNFASSSSNSEKIVLLDEAKRVTPGDYRGHKYIDIREWYKDKGSGEWKPGKKGITLSKSGWQKLITLFPTVDGWLDDGAIPTVTQLF
eukprot:g570.t1